MSFVLVAEDGNTRARAGVLSTAHNQVETPVFMPVGTRASVKAVSPRELDEIGCNLILGNTYHLYLRPGLDVIRDAGGLHNFMGWPGSLLTDSGGYQVFSLAKLRRICDEGVEFRSHIDGQKLFLGPTEAMQIQGALASDIAMVFDECPPYPCDMPVATEAVERTLRWAQVCRDTSVAGNQMLFGIVQGSNYRELREHCCEKLCEMSFEGYAIGGVSVGEPESMMLDVIDWVAPLLPKEKPRYVMGVGTPPQIVQAVARGIDLFDCVLPTRVGRNGCAYTAEGMIQVKAGRLKQDFRPIEEDCACYCCANFSRSYVRHLLNVGEILGLRLLTLHNLYFYHNLMKRMRCSIKENSFKSFSQEFLSNYKPPSGLG